jgi:hypothetical protein
MILTFDLMKPATVPEERLFGLIQRARQIALDIDGVYDLALYRTGRANIWQCSIDTEDERTWEFLQADLRFQSVLEAVKHLGVEITLESRLERQI